MRRLRTILLALATIASLAMIAAAGPVGAHLGTRFGEKILAIGKGKISSPEIFFTHRMLEAGCLLGLAVLLFLACSYLFRALKTRANAWVPLTAGVFVACNVWLFVASKTGLFWASLYTGSITSNFTQFSFKKELLDEHRVPRGVILLGSSQTQAQIDENILNARLQGKVWTTELHFPGSHALDLLVVLRRLRGEPGENVICYLSEYYFYAGANSIAAPYFLSFADIATLKRLGWGREMWTQPFAMGLVADVLPVFACREPLSQRVLGVAMNSLEQARHDANLETNLNQRAVEHAGVFKIDGNSDRQKAAFREFIAEAARQNRRVILLEGEVNPVLAEKIPATVRADMKQFLQIVAREHPNVTIVSEKDLPEQPAGAYLDLTHVKKEVQKEFSEWLALYLERQFSTNFAAVR